MWNMIIGSPRFKSCLATKISTGHCKSPSLSFLMCSIRVALPGLEKNLMRLALQIGFLRTQNKQILFFFLSQGRTTIQKSRHWVRFSILSGLERRYFKESLGGVEDGGWVGTLIQFRSWETYSSILLTAQKNHTVTWDLVIYLLLPSEILVMFSLSSNLYP